MSRIKIWLQAARLRTLPLAASGIIVGAALAWYNDAFSWPISILALVTALLLQILSNFANDYGDFSKGTDNDDRVGPQRTMQSGAITAPQMKMAMTITALLSFVSGMALIYLASVNLGPMVWLFFGVLGLLAIAASILYTVGKRAYGYHGMGDIMVFVFFGLASVLGTYYLNAASLPIEAWSLAIGVGALSTGVLNLNNMRDIDNDIASGKNTFAARLGFPRAKRYHEILILVGIFSFLSLGLSLDLQYWSYLILFIPAWKLFGDLRRIKATTDKASLDPYLKQLSLGTFFMSLMFVVSLVLCSVI